MGNRKFKSVSLHIIHQFNLAAMTGIFLLETIQWLLDLFCVQYSIQDTEPLVPLFSHGSGKFIGITLKQTRLSDNADFGNYLGPEHKNLLTEYKGDTHLFKRNHQSSPVLGDRPYKHRAKELPLGKWVWDPFASGISSDHSTGITWCEWRSLNRCIPSKRCR